ncbi:hypothetical protein F5X68DRAFT_208620, partial [Plectosphaerella plurivora]
MGTLSLNAHPRLAAPDSPPELVSPSSSTYSSRPSPPADLQSWASSSSNGPVSPPMSSYDRSSAVVVPEHSKLADDGYIRSDAAQARPRQQLPSLSSLFGPPSSIRPLHSPMSDRPSAFPATSPLDAPRASPAYSERSYSTSYFPPSTSPSTTQSRGSYSSRYESDRPSSLYPVSGAYQGPESPRQREFEHARRDSRHDSISGARWATSQDGARVDSSRTTHDRYGYQFTGKDAGPSYREQMAPPTPSLMSSNAPSAHVPESVVATDALGPKIWTGTHFLPRFLRAAEVPGEGMCYFYDDGTHCKTVIDGEAVNAHWGVTKAGKPRKRLAIACMTCREKKIKCDPDFPRCVQCEKFGRVCKFKNAATRAPQCRHGHTCDCRLQSHHHRTRGCALDSTRTLPLFGRRHRLRLTTGPRQAASRGSTAPSSSFRGSTRMSCTAHGSP